MNLADLRTSYRRASLAEDDLAGDPFVQFDRWLMEAIASEALEPTAMTLATVGDGGRPSARVVLLKGVDGDDVAAESRGFVWYTNYDSRKGRELAINAYAALCFFWPELERQVRVEGRVEQATGGESDAYFASRPVPSRIGAWASPQSEIIASRVVLEESERAAEARFSLHGTIPRPPRWGGYRLVPDAVEFWQGRPSRLHDRLVFRRNLPSWAIVRLAP